MGTSVLAGALAPVSGAGTGSAIAGEAAAIAGALTASAAATM
ncbi:MAG: hypothetical protein WD810_01635 [Solirubrobacterales bacterium]